MTLLIGLTLLAQAQSEPSLDWSDWAALLPPEPASRLYALDEVQQHLLRRRSARWLREKARALGREAVEEAVLEWRAGAQDFQGSDALRGLALDAAKESLEACRTRRCTAETGMVVAELGALQGDVVLARSTLELAVAASAERVQSRSWIRLAEYRASAGDWTGAAKAYLLVEQRGDAWQRYAAYGAAWTVVQAGEVERGALALAALVMVDDLVGDAVKREVVPLAAELEGLERPLRVVEALCPVGGDCLAEVDRALAHALEQRGRAADADRVLDLRIRGL